MKIIVFNSRVRCSGQIGLMLYVGGSQLSMKGLMTETLSQMGTDTYRPTHNQLVEPIYHQLTHNIGMIWPLSIFFTNIAPTISPVGYITNIAPTYHRLDDMAFIHFFITRFLGSHLSCSGCSFPTGGEGWVHGKPMPETYHLGMG